MDHDRLFKELLGTFFLDFLRLFLPELAAQIEDASLVPLDKEVFTDVTAGQRHEVDLLVRACLKDQPSFFLIHVETQASPQADFARRMFRYFARLNEKYDLPVYPVALFTYEAPRRAEPESFGMVVAGEEVLHFRFRTIQLNRLSWKDFKDVKNPVASALMAKMGVAPKDRPKVKWACYRLLATLRLDPAKTQLIGGFLDAYLRLDPVEEREYQAEVDKASPEDKEAFMEWTNPWIEQGLKEGRERGLREGRQEGHKQGREEGREEGRQVEAANLVVRLLRKRLGELTSGQVDAICRMPVERLERLAEAVFEISQEADLAPWLT
jgi:predicted transposase YdaD